MPAALNSADMPLGFILINFINSKEEHYRSSIFFAMLRRFVLPISIGGDAMRTVLGVICVLFISLSLFANEELWEAARKGDAAKVEALIKKGADPNAKTHYGVSALAFACDRGHVDVVKVLLANGADPKVKDTFYGATPLDSALENGHTEIVKLLLEKGASPDNALLVAAQAGDKKIVDHVLSKYKPSPEILSEALVVASNSNQKEIAEILKAAGARIPEDDTKKVDPEILNSYAGNYKDEDGRDFKIELKDGQLILQSGAEDPIPLKAENETTFKPAGFSGFSVHFETENKKVTGMTLHRANGTKVPMKKVESSALVAEKKPAPITSGKVLYKKSRPNWPSFRGWSASGIADGQNPPLKWNAEKSENIAWKTPIPGLAHSSPVVWGDYVFITTAISSDPSSPFKHGLYGSVTPAEDLSKHTWKIYALDRNSGKILWERVAYEGAPDIKRHPKSSQANSTPVTNGEYVIALFSSGDLIAYDFAGKVQWKKDLGVLDSGFFYDPDYQWAYGSSPIIYKNLVILQCDLQKNSYIAAFDIRNGKQVWMTSRDEIPSWGSPTIVEGTQRAELIANGTRFVRGYDPESGKELWRLSGNSEITVPTPIYADGLIYVTSGYTPIQPIYAIRTGANGNITLKENEEANQFIAWSKKRGGPYMPTPIVYGDYLYTCANNGVLTCYNAKTGERIYQQRLGGKGSSYAFTASPIAADGKIYFTSEDGEIFVVKAGPEFEILSVNPVGEVCMATPAISDGMLILRAQEHVYGIRDNSKQ